MKSLLLLDADVIIHFHELGYWKSILTHYQIHVPSTVFQEVKFYLDKDTNAKCGIDLQKYVDSGQIIEVGSSVEEQAFILKKLEKPQLSEDLGPGELECITILHEEKIEEIILGIKDGLAIKALSFLDLDEKAICLEEILLNCGILRKKQKVRNEYSLDRFRRLVRDGKFLQISEENVRVKK